jgi:heme oxygenase (biliverdin-IX-beta and delta-forming)
MGSVNVARAEGALDQLRAATADCHRRLEKRMDVGHRFSSAAGYRDYLGVMFGFYAPFERALGSHAVRSVLTDFPARCKTALLADDLAALGVSADCVARLPRCSEIPFCQDEAAALGSLYVLEGATLGGQVLLPMVEQRLRLTRASGASYLGSYGRDTRAMWQRLGSVVESWCADSERRAMAAAAAVATFEALEAWACGDPE